MGKVNRAKAKELIMNIFKKGKIIYYSDIAKQTKLNLELIVSICNELEEQGKIKESRC